jgi:hypothetical protein
MRFAFLLLSSVALSQTVMLEDFPSIMEIATWRVEYKQATRFSCIDPHGYEPRRACAIRQKKA